MKRVTRYFVPIILTLAFATVAAADCPVFKVIRSFPFSPPTICVRVLGGPGSGLNYCLYDCDGVITQ